MNKKNVSRRQFLHMLSGIGVTPFIAKLSKFFPETNSSLAKRDAKVRALLELPEDLEMQAIEGDQAAAIISQVLEYGDTVKLLKSFKPYKPALDGAHVTAISWEYGAKKATVVSIPFTHAKTGVAVLQCVLKDEAAEIFMVKFQDQENLSVAKVYTVKNGEAAVFDADLATTPVGGPAVIAEGTCTAQILIQCLGLWGCSGLALTTCAAALILCPFTIWSCIAVYTCALYCGGAWSYCFCWACGC
jgi:hypothetical protein